MFAWFSSIADTCRTVVQSTFQNSITRRRVVIVLAAFLVMGYALGVLSYVLTTPEIGIRCAFSLVVNRVYDEFLYPEDQRAPSEGDEVLRVGRETERLLNWSQFLRRTVELKREQPTRVPFTPAELLGRTGPGSQFNHVLLDDPATAAPVELVRVDYRPSGASPETEASVWCRVGHSPIETLVPLLLWFFLKIGLFAVGGLVFWKRPEDRSAAAFFVLCVASLGAYIGGYQWSRIITQPVLLLGFMVSAVLFPAVSLHFYLVFPRPKQFLDRWPRRVLAVIYGPPVAFLAYLLAAYIYVRVLAGVPGPESAAAVRDALQQILNGIYGIFAIAALWYVASIACLVHSFRTSTDLTERNQVKWILFGALAAVAPIGYSLYLAFLQQGKFGGGAATWPMFAASAIVTAAYTVAITRYRLMQLDQLLSSWAVYLVASSVAGLVYYGLVFTAMLLVGSQVSEHKLEMWQVLVVGGTAVVLMLALDYLRGWFKTTLDRHYRREKYQLDRTLLRMRQAIDQLVDPATLANRLLHTSAELFGAARGAVFLRQGEPPIYQLTAAIGAAPGLTQLPLGCPLLERVVAQGALEARPRLPADDPARRQLRFLGGEAAISLMHEGRLLGLLVLGPRDGGAYTAEDLNLLTAFAQVAVVALVSAEGHRTIEILNRDLQTKVEKIAEQQRRIIVLQSQLSKQSVVRALAAANGAEPGAVPENSQPLPESEPQSTNGIVGSGAKVHHLMHLVRKVAASPSAVLLRGESGTGKELLARAVHEHSARAGKAFVKVHCAALSPGLLESELFGHVKGAFTNAIRDKVGRFESAHGGTLFLDEIGDVSLEVQTKLLRVLQEKTFERVGSSEPVTVDVRIVAATHQNLEELIRRGQFREDLYYRLNVISIQVPPLRERVEDIPELATHFIRVYAEKAGKALTGLDDDALARLKAYRWPGNIRQLENVMERAVVISEGGLLTVDELPEELLEATEEAATVPFPWPGALAVAVPDGEPAPTATASFVQVERVDRERRERELLVRALSGASGNKAEAARALGMARSTLISRLKRLGLS